MFEALSVNRACTLTDKKAKVWSLCLMFLSHLSFFVTFLGALRFNKAGLSHRNVVVNCPYQVLLLFFLWTKHHKKCKIVWRYLLFLSDLSWLICSFPWCQFEIWINLMCENHVYLAVFSFQFLQQQIWPCTRQHTKVPFMQIWHLIWSSQHQQQWMETEIQKHLKVPAHTLPVEILCLGLWWILGRFTQLEEWILQTGWAFLVSRICK